MGVGAEILVLPGGGYEEHARHEAEPVAEWLESLGYAAKVVRYPISPTRYPVALRLVRAEILAARERSAGPVGVIGFSAGGHLAGSAAYAPSDDPGTVPDFVVLGYPVVSMGVGAHEPSRANLLGDDLRLAELLSVDRLVTLASPPTFLWHTADDEIVPVRHSLLLASALAAHAVDFELHVFPHGAHGLALAENTSVGAWRALCATWLTATLAANPRSAGRLAT